VKARVLAALSLALLVSRSAAAGPAGTDPLRTFSDAIEALVKRVSPSVVQVLVTGYGPLEETAGNTDLVIGRQRSIGSGAVIDADGYIVTNAHVIAGGQRIEVVLPGAAADEAPMRSLTNGRGRVVEAHVVGVATEVDLALLKVEASGLPAMQVADYDTLRTGQLVFAFGSPEGLRNSVTMGVVSAVARQPDPDHPLVYIQTDAPINRGNSGGPLVNSSGELVGINAFILTDSGGSQGLGFAIPSAIVSVACSQLRKYGHLHRGEIGVELQTITPDLARGLGLARDRGVIVSDVAPDGPADAAGLKVRDIILSVNGRPTDTLVELAFHLYRSRAGDSLRLSVIRDQQPLVIDVPVIERAPDLDRLVDRVDPETSLVRELGIIVLTIAEEVGRMLSSLRLPFGVVVAARAQDSRTADVSLSTGDVIHTVNGLAVVNLTGLRSILSALEPHSAVVLQIERDGKFIFVAFELD
jgi:serine protease Do